MKGNGGIRVALCFTAVRTATKRGQDGGGPGLDRPVVLVEVVVVMAPAAVVVAKTSKVDTIEIDRTAITISGD